MEAPEEQKEIEPKPIGVYGPNDKPKGAASVVPDDPMDIFPVDDGDPDKSPTKSD